MQLHDSTRPVLKSTKRSSRAFLLVALGVFALVASACQPGASGVGYVSYAHPNYGFTHIQVGGSGTVKAMSSSSTCVGGIGVYSLDGSQTYAMKPGVWYSLGWAANGASVVFGSPYGPEGCSFNYSISVG